MFRRCAGFSWPRGCFGGAAALLTLFLSATASAGVLRLELVTKVRVGQSPSLRVVADQLATQTVLELTREDGKELIQRIGTLESGAAKEIVLDGAVGRHHYQGRLKGEVDGAPEVTPVAFDTVVAPPLEVAVDKSKVDLDQGHLEITLSREAAQLELKLLGVGGKELGESSMDLTGRAPRKPIRVSWSPLSRDLLVRIEIRVTDADGFFNGVALMPWSVSIPHEQVNFDTDSEKIKPTEEPKLTESLTQIRQALARYQDLDNVKLFIAGHTDTRGAAAYNLDLSRRRARSIAAWFAQNGLTLPILFEGFGEAVPVVKTEDEVDEPRNRRVDYILAVEDPSSKSTGARAGWKRVNK